MYKGLLILSFLIILPFSASAEQLKLGGTVLTEPVCFVVRNTADHSVMGNIATNYYLHQERQVKARHRSNFRLQAAGSIDSGGLPEDWAEFCSYGTFFEGMKLELVLRTLFPVFSCFTKADQGEILIKSERRADDSGVRIWAECFE